MKTSVIRRRVPDFLKQHAPFDALPEDDLLALAGSGRVKFHESEEYVFRQGQPKGQQVWMIQQGQVELVEDHAGAPLRDVLGEGDLLGLERFVGDGSYRASARTATDVILYAMDAALLESLISRHAGLQRFLLAHFSVSGMSGFGRTSWLDAEAPPLDFLRARSNRNGRTGAEVGCHSTPAAPLTTRAAVREMLSSRTDKLEVAAGAVLTAADLALFCGRNPARLVRAIREAASREELVPLLRLAARLVADALAQPADVDDCCRIGDAVTAAAAEACIRLAGRDVEAAGLEPPAVPACWVMFGAAARGDLLAPVLPVIAAVYDDAHPAYTRGDGAWFAALAGETAAWFHACGLDGPGLVWPQGSQPCMPLSEWKRLYGETIRNPLGHDLYARREFLDLAPLCGELAVLEKMRQHILEELRRRDVVVRLLANDTLAHLPPLTFFRGLVVELDGAQRSSFDAGSTAIAPIADAARVFAIAKRRLAPAGTLARLEWAAGDFPEQADALREAADAFRLALFHQTVAGTSRIDAAQLGKFDQVLFKRAFSAVQRLLEATDSTLIPDE